MYVSMIANDYLLNKITELECLISEGNGEAMESDSEEMTTPYQKLRSRLIHLIYQQILMLITYPELLEKVSRE